jgi:hypothetical protein
MESSGYWLARLLWEVAKLLWQVRVGCFAALACALVCGYLFGPWFSVLGLICGVWFGFLLEVRLRQPSNLEGESWYYALVLSAGLFPLVAIVIWFALSQAR